MFAMGTPFQISSEVARALRLPRIMISCPSLENDPPFRHPTHDWIGEMLLPLAGTYVVWNHFLDVLPRDMICGAFISRKPRSFPVQQNASTCPLRTSANSHPPTLPRPNPQSEIQEANALMTQSIPPLQPPPFQNRPPRPAPQS